MALFPVSTGGVSKEYADALIDAQSTCREYGILVFISLRGEVDVSRDKYNSVKQHHDVDTPLHFYGNPIQYQPSQKQLEKAGISEPVDVVAYTAMQDWIDHGFKWDDIDVVRTTVTIQGNEMMVKAKGYYGEYGTGYLYITLGLVRK